MVVCEKPRNQSKKLKKFLEENKMPEKKIAERKTELSETKIEQLNKMPIIESQVNKSDDGKWIINKTIITSIKPTKYFEKVLATAGA